MYVIPFVPIKSTDDIEESISVKGTLMKCSLRRRVTYGNNPCPRIKIKLVFVDVVEPLLLLVDASKYIHGFVISNGRMSISTFDRSLSVHDYFPVILYNVVL